MVAAASLALAGCQGGTWNSNDVRPVAGTPAAAKAANTPPSSDPTYRPPAEPSVPSAAQPTDPAKIVVTPGDIADRPYRVVAAIKVQVNKTTIFNPSPTRELVDEQLRKEASRIGADAVIKAQYSDVHVTLVSWGTMTGSGDAIKFDK